MDELEAIDRALPEAGEPDPAAQAAARRRLVEALDGAGGGGRLARRAKWPRRHGQLAVGAGLLAVLAGAAVIAASLRDHRTVAPRPHTATIGSRLTTVGPPRVRPPACDARDLTSLAYPSRVARTGRNPMTVQIIYSGRRPCYLPRRVALTVLDRNGVRLPFDVRAAGPASGSIRITSITPVELGLDAYRCDAGDRAAAATLRVDLGRSGVLRVSVPAGVHLAWCGAGDPGSVLELAGLKQTDPGRDGWGVTLTRIDAGVACATPHSVRCGRLGIAAFATGPLARIEASLGAYRVSLHRTGGGYYQGFVQARDLTAPPFAIHADARGRWYGSPRATVTIRLVGRGTDGSSLDFTVDVPIAAGFG